MNHPPRLRPEDRPDFQWVLHLAFGADDIRAALDDGRATEDIRRLRAGALAAADAVAAPAAPEYRAFLKARAASAAPPATPPPSGPGTVLLPTLAVLAPLVSAVAAVLLLLLGYGLHLAGTDSELAAALTGAGWFSAAFAALSGAVGLGALLVTALRRRTEPALRIRGGQVREAREEWQRALLERGVLPYLREELALPALGHGGTHHQLPDSGSAPAP